MVIVQVDAFRCPEIWNRHRPTLDEVSKKLQSDNYQAATYLNDIGHQYLPSDPMQDAASEQMDRKVLNLLSILDSTRDLSHLTMSLNMYLESKTDVLLKLRTLLTWSTSVVRYGGYRRYILSTLCLKVLEQEPKLEISRIVLDWLDMASASGLTDTAATVAALSELQQVKLFSYHALLYSVSARGLIKEGVCMSSCSLHCKCLTLCVRPRTFTERFFRLCHVMTIVLQILSHGAESSWVLILIPRLMKHLDYQTHTRHSCIVCISPTRYHSWNRLYLS